MYDNHPNPDGIINPPVEMVGYGQYEIGEIPTITGRPKGVWIVYGGQVGSEGKGAIVGYLARKHPWGAAICTFMTNAGHTWVPAGGGDSVVVQQLPMGVVSPSVERLLIGPGAALTLERLEQEINTLEARGFQVERRLQIHPRTMIIEEEHRVYEKEALAYIGSTGKGCGAALADKVLRRQSVRMARDVAWLKPYLNDTTQVVNEAIDSGRGVLAEGAQGFDLDINHGIDYPHCTSRGTTPMQVLADCGIDGRMVVRSIAVLRTFPIRVGGPSGPFGAREIDWAQVSAHAGRAVQEITTVTKKVRRVFEMDYDRLATMSQTCRPTDLALTGADYVEPVLAGATLEDIKLGMPRAMSEMVWKIEKAAARRTARPRVRLIKTGPADDQIIDLLGPRTTEIPPEQLAVL